MQDVPSAFALFAGDFCVTDLVLAWKIHAHCTGLGSILVTVQDISELEQLRYTLTDTEAVLHDTRRELQEQTEVFGTMESMARTGYWRRIRDEGESVLLWSPGLCDIAGFERQEWIGTERALSGVLPEDRHVIASAPTDEPAGDVEYRWRRPDGEVRWMRSRTRRCRGRRRAGGDGSGAGRDR
ncbi:MAG: PAS domain-containing protein [Simplicispira sp.]|nr:PAS domain-containing protein [Simplicispira sp.]